MAGVGDSASSSPLHAGQVSAAALQVRVLPLEQAGPVTIARTLITVDANTGTGTIGAVADTDEINLLILPPRCELLLGTSTLILSASQGTATFIDLGFRTYLDKAKVAVAEDVDGILVSFDATVTTQQFLATATGSTLGAKSNVSGVVVFDNGEPLTIFMKARVAAFDGDIGDTYGFVFHYVKM